MRQTKVLSPLPTPPSREMQKGTLAPAAFETPRARVRAAAGRGLTSGKPLQPPPPVREAKYSPSASMPTMYFVFLWKVTITVRVLKMFTYAGQLPTPPEQNAQAPLTSAAKT